MRAPRFVHLGIAWTPRLVTAEVDAVVDEESIDWMRYSICCYVLWTTSDTETIVRKVQRVPSLVGLNVFAVEMSVDNSYGMLSDSLWSWFKAKDKDVLVYNPDNPSELSEAIRLTSGE